MMMRNEFPPEVSASSINICGDTPLSLPAKFKWVQKCYKNNQAPYRDVDPRIKFVNFGGTEKIFDDWGEGSGELPVSPARFVSNAFWSWIDFSGLHGDGQINALEVGCGTGIYGQILKQKLSSRLSLYRGIDIVEHEEWKLLTNSGNFEFDVARAENIGPYLNDVNLLITQSAIEHFESDLEFFRQVSEYANTVQEKFWQIHLLPCAECLRTFLWHGYRQYTPSTLSKITRLFPDDAEFLLYRLGGDHLNNVHFKYITLPSLFLRRDLRGALEKKYLEEARSAAQEDHRRLERKDASFYALVIKTGS